MVITMDSREKMTSQKKQSSTISIRTKTKFQNYPLRTLQKTLLLHLQPFPVRSENVDSAIFQNCAISLALILL